MSGYGTLHRGFLRYFDGPLRVTIHSLVHAHSGVDIMKIDNHDIHVIHRKRISSILYEYTNVNIIHVPVSSMKRFSTALLMLFLPFTVPTTMQFWRALIFINEKKAFKDTNSASLKKISMIISNGFELHVPNVVFWYFYSSSLGASAYLSLV